MLGVVLALGLGACSSDDPCAVGEPGVVCFVAGTGNLGFNQEDMPPEDTDFYLVSRARRGPDDLLYFVDFNNWRIRRLGEDGLIHAFVGNGVHSGAFPGVPALESPLDNPSDCDFLPDGRMVIVSPEDLRVLEIDVDGIVHVFAGSTDAGEIGNEGDGGSPLNALFMELSGVAAGPDGALYLADSGAGRVRVIRDDIITTLAGTGEPVYAGDGGPATDAALQHPSAVAVDGAGNVFISDSYNNVVRRVSPDGIIDTVAGTGQRGLAGDGGPATQAELDEPYGLAVGPDGALYIADRNNFRIRRVGADGIIDTLAGTDQGQSGDGGPALEAQFGVIAHVTLDGDWLLIADQSNSMVRRVHL